MDYEIVNLWTMNNETVKTIDHELQNNKPWNYENPGPWTTKQWTMKLWKPWTMNYKTMNHETMKTLDHELQNNESLNYENPGPWTRKQWIVNYVMHRLVHASCTT
jgi:hypothetical protein